jgi:hypothetical protein
MKHPPGYSEDVISTKGGNIKRDSPKSSKPLLAIHSKGKIASEVNSLKCVETTIKEAFLKIKAEVDKHNQTLMIDELIKVVKAALSTISKKECEKLSQSFFHAIFTINIAKEIEMNKDILNKFYSVYQIRNQEIDLLLNLQQFLSFQHADTSFEKYISTILKLLFDNDLLSGVFLIDWGLGEHDKEIKNDHRFNEKLNNLFKESAKPLVDWLKEDDDCENDV